MSIATIIAIIIINIILACINILWYTSAIKPNGMWSGQKIDALLWFISITPVFSLISALTIIGMELEYYFETKHK